MNIHIGTLLLIRSEKAAAEQMVASAREKGQKVEQALQSLLEAQEDLDRRSQEIEEKERQQEWESEKAQEEINMSLSAARVATDRLEERERGVGERERRLMTKEQEVISLSSSLSTAIDEAEAKHEAASKRCFLS